MSPSGAGKLCLWCALKPALPGGHYCGKRCRQSAFRLRRRRRCFAVNETPGRFAYADPPYIGEASRCYGAEPDFAGEVDHRQLVERLQSGGYTGWALSASSKLRSLREILPLLPEHARVCSWRKPAPVPQKTRGAHGTWEALIIVGGRQLAPGVPDSLQAHAARGWGDLPGRKPLAFCAWLFDLLGLLPGDTLDDLFPGTGAVSRAWRELSPRTSATLSEDARELLRTRLLPQLPSEASSDARPAPALTQLSLLQPEAPRG